MSERCDSPLFELTLFFIFSPPLLALSFPLSFSLFSFFFHSFSSHQTHSHSLSLTSSHRKQTSHQPDTTATNPKTLSTTPTKHQTRSSGQSNMGQTLSAPITEKHSSAGHDKRFAYGASAMQGWRISILFCALSCHVMSMPMMFFFAFMLLVPSNCPGEAFHLNHESACL